MSSEKGVPIKFSTLVQEVQVKKSQPRPGAGRRHIQGEGMRCAGLLPGTCSCRISGNSTEFGESGASGCNGSRLWSGIVGRERTALCHMYSDEPGGSSFEVGRVDELEKFVTVEAFMGCSNSADDVNLKLVSVTMGTMKDVLLRRFFDRGRVFRHGNSAVKC